MAIESPPQRSRRCHRSPLGYLITGIVIAVYGLALLANNLGFGDIQHYLQVLWPFASVLLGIALLTHGSDGRRQAVFWGVVLIFAGVWGYATQQGWIHVNFWAVFGPTMLILLGASFLYRAFESPRGDPANAAFIRSFALMSGNELKPTTTPFTGADIGSFLGGVVLDLTGAQMEGDSATVNVFTILGGIEILVPADWTVTTKVTSFMGACVDKRRPPTVPRTKTLVVQGFACLGGIDIKD